MTNFYRRLFFWIFVCLFVVTAPLAVLYTQGYRFDQYKKIFIHSGSVTVKSTPSSANIYLNGQLRPSGTLNFINNSITINGLRPGNYSLRLAADGYKDWEKSIEIHSGVSTEFWNVYLAPNNFSPLQLSADGAEKYFPSSSGKNIAFFKKNGDNLEIWSLNAKNNTPSLVFSQNNLEFSDDPTENIEWDSKEKLFLVPVVSSSRKNFLVLDSEKSQEPIVFSQSAPNLSDFDHARWSPANSSEVFFLAKPNGISQNNLYRLDLDTKNLETIIEGIKTYDLASNSIYFVSDNNIIYKASLDGKNESQMILSGINFADSGAKARLIAYDDYRQAIVSEAGELFVHNNGESGETLKKIADGVKDIQFSNDGKKLLYWNESEIDVLFLRQWDVQPRREESEIQQVARFSSPVKNVFWYRDYEHIFFSTQNTVKMIELDPRDHRAVADLFKYNSENFLSSYDSGNGIYYYLDEIDGTKKLFYLHIPEQTSFFGG